MGQITTSRVSRKGCNKFRVKSQRPNLHTKANNSGTTMEISRTSSR